MKKNNWYDNLNQRELKIAQRQKDNQDDVISGVWLCILIVFFIIGVIYLRLNGSP